MPSVLALTHVSQMAFGTVADTVRLSSGTRTRVGRALEHEIRWEMPSRFDIQEFAGWAEDKMGELLSREDVTPYCPYSLAAWFGQEVANWVGGSFDEPSPLEDEQDEDITAEPVEGNLMCSV